MSLLHRLLPTYSLDAGAPAPLDDPDLLDEIYGDAYEDFRALTTDLPKRPGTRRG